MSKKYPFFAVNVLAVFLALGSGEALGQTVSTFDVLVATETLTVVGTTTLRGNSFSVGTSTVVVVQGNVGIGTTTPQGQFHIFGPVVSGAQAQLIWNSSKAALRAGEFSGTRLDASNIGQHTVAFGQNGIAAHEADTVAGGNNNQITSGAGTWSTIGGGDSNLIAGFTADANLGTIGGGQDNDIRNYSDSTIGGGSGNTARSTGGTISGGGFNSVGVDGETDSWATVGGGEFNHAYAYASVVAGGGGIGPSGANGGNIVNNTGGSILGGANNTVSGDYGTIAGGAFNYTAGAYAAVLGGYKNYAYGRYSVVAGSSATATAPGSFVWADSQARELVSNTTDEFKIRAGGGIVLLSSPTLSTIIVSSGSIEISTSPSAASAVPNLFISSTSGKLGIGTASPSTTLDVNGDVQFGTGTAKSTFTAAGLLQLTAAGIRWADGTTSTTAASGSGGGGTLNRSSSTEVNGTFVANAVLAGPCIAGTTVTITCQGTGELAISYSAMNLASDSAVEVILAPIVDGTWLPGRSNTSSYVGTQTNGASGGPASHLYISTALCSAGTHTGCLTFGPINTGGAIGTVRGPVRITMYERP